MPTVTHKMLADKKNEFRTILAGYKKKIEAQMPKYKSACEALVAKIKDYNAKQRDFDKACNSRNGERLDKAIESAEKAYTVYSDIRSSLMLIHTTVIHEFDLLVEMSDATSSIEGDKSRADRGSYQKYFTDLLTKNSKSLEQVTIPAFILADEKKTGENRENEEIKEEAEPPKSEPVPTPAEPQKVGGANVTSVNIAPITLDVTKIVERAIAAAMEKLSAGMERKIEEYISSLTIPTPDTQTANPLASQIDALNTVADYEEQIVKKIADICNTLRTVVDGLVALSASASELGEKQQQLSAIQKQINELQRQTVRDQQGVSVNQRLISEELAAVVKETSDLVSAQASLTAQMEEIRTAKK